MLRKYIIYVPTGNMYNGKQGEQLLKKGGQSASLDRTSKMQRAKLYPVKVFRRDSAGGDS